MIAVGKLMTGIGVDRCRLCGNLAVMTTEHAPPRAAGNTEPLRVHTLNSIANGFQTGQRFQAGLTRNTLCEPCNNRCGHLYVRPFARWTIQAAEYHRRLDAGNQVLLPFVLDPLAISKEIAVMTLAMSSRDSIDLTHYVALRRFALAPRQSAEIREFRFFVYLHSGPPVFEGYFAAIDTRGGPSPHVYCQVGLEPLGYIVTSDDPCSIQWARKLRLCDVTGFATRSPSMLRVEHLMLPMLRGALPFRPLPRRPSRT
jgi:hypothetical protein